MRSAMVSLVCSACGVSVPLPGVQPGRAGPASWQHPATSCFLLGVQHWKGCKWGTARPCDATPLVPGVCVWRTWWLKIIFDLILIFLMISILSLVGVCCCKIYLLKIQFAFFYQQDNLQGYKTQNKFLNKEILELSALRRNAEAREREWQAKVRITQHVLIFAVSKVVFKISVVNLLGECSRGTEMEWLKCIKCGILKKKKKKN